MWSKAITCPGDLKAVEGTKMRCQLEASNGSKIGLTLTRDHMYDVDHRFGFGEVSGSGFPGESPGLLPAASTCTSTRSASTATPSTTTPGV